MTAHSITAQERRWSSAAAHAGVRATHPGDARELRLRPMSGPRQHAEPVTSEATRADPGTPRRQKTTGEQEQDTGADVGRVCDPPITEGGPAPPRVPPWGSDRRRAIAS